MSKDRVKRFDGDIIFSTSDSIVIKGIQGGNPISYDKPKAKKFLISNQSLFESDGFSFGSKIGFITNISSTFHAMLSDFETDSPEYMEIKKRLKLLRMYQGFEIDSAKLGGYKKPIPATWTKWQKTEDDMSDDEKARIKFDNSLLADKRPTFFRHLYSHYQANYRKKHLEREFWARQYNKSFEELSNTHGLSKDEEEGVDYYNRRFPYIENNSVMAIVERYCYNEIKENQVKLKKEKFDYNLILKKRQSNFLWVDEYYKLYKYLRSISKFDSEEFSPNTNVEKVVRERVFEEVSSDIDYILDCVVLYFYEYRKLRETDFVWNVFGKDLIYRLLESKEYYEIPKRDDETPEYEYLWSGYTLEQVPLEKNEERIR